MGISACNCSLPIITGSNKCCENCNNNWMVNTTTTRTFSNTYVVPVEYIKPIHKCKYCGIYFMSDVAKYCPECGKSQIE